MRPMRPHLLLTLALLASCAAVPGEAEAPVLLLGEQHDAPEHQRLHHQAVAGLAGSGRLAALVLEMAQQGHSTARLPPQAGESEVRAALGWDERAWPWQPYAPAIMAAVRAGVPVVGANLARERMRQAMADAQLDALLPAASLQAQQQAIRRGHCELLPESQIGPMTRIQIARDRAMAEALAATARPGKTVVLLAGAGHVDPQLGVPLHLPPGLAVRPVVHPPQASGKDYCAELRQQLKPRS
jgi:uncharacterized iron-regulated protein